jgi:GST-like protein
MTIELYGMTSPNVRKVFFMLEECGLPYRFHHVQVFQGDQFQPEFVQLNPNSKVPVIVDNDGPGGKPYTVFESGAILLYLAEKTGQWLPPDIARKHTVMQWLMLQMASVGPMFGQLNHFRNFSEGNEYARQRYEHEVLRLFAVLDTRLAESPYLAGPDYSIADIATYPWAMYHEQYEFDWKDHPHVKRWCDAIGARPAIQRGLAAVDELQPLDRKSMKEADPADVDRFLNRSWMHPA